MIKVRSESVAVSFLKVLFNTWSKSNSLNGKEFELKKHLEGALDWIREAQTHTTDGGVSKGYDLLRGRWAPSYPETTGYTIPTLLNAADVLQRPDIKAQALSLADYLLKVITPEGGVVHWKSASQAQAIVFDTGQVMFGWLAAYKASREGKYLGAAREAGDWLVSIQDPTGAWIRNQYLGFEKVIDTRVAWVLLELNRLVGDRAYVEVARHNLEWAVENQHADGWFEHCAFTSKQDPLTHTIAYTAEGLFECGVALNEPRYIQAAQKTARALLDRQRQDGSLAGTYGPDWQETSRWSCLTGNCQMAHLWLRLFELEGDARYAQAALNAIQMVAKTQILDSQNPNIHGAIAGSFPVSGAYERLKLPNWATKFFVDALLAQERIDRGARLKFDYPG